MGGKVLGRLKKKRGKFPGRNPSRKAADAEDFHAYPVKKNRYLRKRRKMSYGWSKTKSGKEGGNISANSIWASLVKKECQERKTRKLRKHHMQKKRKKGILLLVRKGDNVVFKKRETQCVKRGKRKGDMKRKG